LNEESNQAIKRKEVKMKKLLLGIITLMLIIWAQENIITNSGHKRFSLKDEKVSLIDETPAIDAITIPRMLSYQGKLTDSLGNPVPDGNYQLTLRLYTQETGGSPFWTEIDTVMVKKGLFSVLLGARNPITSIPDAGGVYLSLQVGTNPELTPRLRIVSSAYSFLSERSANADLLQGKDTTALDSRYVNENQANSVTSSMIVNGTILGEDINQMGATSGQVLKWTGSTWAPRNDSIATGAGDNDWVRGTPDSVLYTIRQLGIARGGANNMLWGNNRFTHVNFGVACTTGTSGQNYQYITIGGGYHNVASGINTTVAGGLGNKAYSPGATVGGGGYNSATNSDATVAGGFYNIASGFRSTVAGGDSCTASGNRSTVGGGLQNIAGAHGSTIAGGTYNTTSGAGGATVGGGNGNTASSADATVGGGYQNTASGYRATIGGGWSNYASDTSATVAGGRADTASSRYATVGGGYSNLASGRYSTIAGGNDNTASGYAATVAGGSGCSALGNYSFAAGFNSIVEASYSNSAAFNGQTATASDQLRCGTLSKAGGSFTIDHPVDPYNKILNHYFIEGPEMRNLYDGEVILDESGLATVHLPDYFNTLNRKPRIQLTGVGTSDVYVAEDIKGNTFVIGGKPGTKVYWQVTGERADISAEAIRRMMPVEQPKTGGLAGRMLDDEFLSGCMEQLEREGKAQGLNFRTPEGRRRYEQMKNREGLGR